MIGLVIEAEINTVLPIQLLLNIDIQDQYIIVLTMFLTVHLKSLV